MANIDTIITYKQRVEKLCQHKMLRGNNTRFFRDFEDEKGANVVDKMYKILNVKENLSPDNQVELCTLNKDLATIVKKRKANHIALRVLLMNVLPGILTGGVFHLAYFLVHFAIRFIKWCLTDSMISSTRDLRFPLDWSMAVKVRDPILHKWFKPFKSSLKLIRKAEALIEDSEAFLDNYKPEEENNSFHSEDDDCSSELDVEVNCNRVGSKNRYDNQNHPFYGATTACFN